MIARNEEANVAACLEPLVGLVEEIVLVDTGSTDQTKETARRLGAEVFDFPWSDDFAASRNESINRARCSWIFWMDADDRIDETNRSRLQKLFESLANEKTAYKMLCVGSPDPDGGAGSVTDHIRLFPNHAEVRWQYRVHEQILPALKRLEIPVRPTNVIIQHTGYLDPHLKARKSERNLRLLEREYADNPNDPHTLFYLGQTYLMMGAPLRALPYLRRCMEFMDPRNPIAPHIMIFLAQTLFQTGEIVQAFSICQVGRGHFPDNPDLLFLDGVIRQARNDGSGAEMCWNYLLEGEAVHRFSSIDPSMYDKVRHKLALGYLKQGRLDEAEGQWRAVLATRPNFTPAWLGLTDICMARCRPALGEALLESARAVPGNGLNVALIQAQLLEKQGKVPEAKKLLQQICAEFGRALPPRIALSRLLLAEGRDWAAAEHALRNVLEIDPNNKEAQYNLALLLNRGSK